MNALPFYHQVQVVHWVLVVHEVPGNTQIFNLEVVTCTYILCTKDLLVIHHFLGLQEPPNTLLVPVYKFKQQRNVLVNVCLCTHILAHSSLWPNWAWRSWLANWQRKWTGEIIQWPFASLTKALIDFLETTFAKLYTKN